MWKRGLVIALLVGLAKADGAAIGVVAPALESDLHITTAEIGLLASLGAITGALAALPAGSMVDRRHRVAVITVALVVWSLVLGVAGLATGFVVLAVARVISGGVATVARPAAVSMTGDTFEPAERGRALAVLAVAGVVGTALCYLLGAVAVGVANWRWLFIALAGAGIGLALASSRLDEPMVSRGQSPRFTTVLGSLVRIRTNLVVQVADSISTFFFAGVTTFAVLFVTRRYGLPASLVDALVPALAVGIVAGNLAGGRVGDRLAGARDGSSRLVVAAACQLTGAAIFAVALLNRSLVVAGAFLFAGAAILGAAGPCLDAVRMDVLPPGIRGRAEAARGLLTLGSGALGPVTFGLIAGALAGRGQGIVLRDAFMWMLLPLAAGALTLTAAIRSYDSDALAAARVPAHVLDLPEAVAPELSVVEGVLSA